MDYNPSSWIFVQLNGETYMFEEVFATSQGQVLRFLACHIGQSFYEQEIVERTGVSRSAVNLATRALHQAGLLRRERRGRMNFYAADDRHPFVRYFKVLDTIAQLEPLLRELRPLARRILLFGSCAEGTDTADSDVDLFILASDRSQVVAAISHFRFGRRIQPVVVNSQELVAMKQDEPAFYAQVKRGMVLWEAINELAS
jgi:DNA-binding transcriptional ArsR family regulator